jgi:chromosomal replication initiation ATPase DnaA
VPFPDIQRIVAAVAGEFQITGQQLCGRSTDPRLSHPRHLAVLLCKEFTTASQAEIGEALGRRRWRTIASMEKRASDLIDVRPELFDRLERIRGALRNQL